MTRRSRPREKALVLEIVARVPYQTKPAWSLRLNADFEDHAEHTYAEMVVENPAYETTPWDSALCGEYGSYGSLADLLRQVSHDERCHKQESEQHLREPRVR